MADLPYKTNMLLSLGHKNKRIVICDIILEFIIREGKRSLSFYLNARLLFVGCTGISYCF